MATDTMKALVWRGPGELALEDWPMPKITKNDDVIIKVTLNAICTSDVHIAAGHMGDIIPPPRILGHEFCGEIVELGSAVQGFKVGDRVLVEGAATCGVCDNCKTGKRTFCQTPGYGMFGVNGPDGCQAEYMKLISGAGYMRHIPDGLTEEDVILVPDMLCTGWFALTKTRAGLGDTVVVIGTGPVGLSTCIIAKLFGAKTVIAVDIIDYLPEAALKNGAADYVINPDKEDLVARVAEITKGKMAECVVETVGMSHTLNMGISVAGFEGRLCTVAFPAGELTIERSVEAMMKNMDISIGIQLCAGIDILLDCIAKGKINAKWLLTHKAPLNDIARGYETFITKQDGCIKWLTTPYER